MVKSPVSQKLLITVAISVACQGVYAALPPSPSPFSEVPANLVEVQTTTTSNTVRPNVMLLVDDSGSMDSPANAWSIFGPTRINVVKQALIQVLDVYNPRSANFDLAKNPEKKEMNWNMITLCGTARGNYSQAQYPVSTGTYLPVDQMYSYVNNLRAYCNTPSTNRYLQASQYAYRAIQYQCQKNFIVFLSDGDANSEGINSYNRLSNEVKAVYGSVPWGYDAYYGNLGHGISFFSHKLQGNDLRTTGVDAEGSAWDGVQNIQTYSVGFGNGLSGNGLNYLRHAGIADNSAESYFKADSAQELIDAFGKIFKNIADSSKSGGAQTTSTAAPTAMSAQIDGLAANLSLDTGIWSSEIRFNKLDKSGKPVLKPDGSNDYYSADYQGRQIIMNNGSENYFLNTAAGSRYQDFGFNASQQDEFSQAFLPWLRRDSNMSDIAIQQKATQLQSQGKTLLVNKGYRKRSDGATDVARQMGDVLNTNVLAMGNYVITGANDGMVYIFKKTTQVDVPYKLHLNYLPGGMQRESDTETLANVLPTIAQANYGQPDNPHIYGINGNMRYVITPKTADRQQQTVLMGTMGQGGRGAFALRIAGCDSKRTKNQSCSAVGLDSNALLTQVPLWETAKGSSNKLGYTFSKPSIYPVTTEEELKKGSTVDKGIRMGAFLANGFRPGNKSLPYDSAPTLYIYDMLGEDFSNTPPTGISSGTAAGTLLKAISVSGTASSALASPTVLDVDRDGVADVAYAGDYNGDLYRFDLRGPVAQWKAVKIYAGNSTQPITAPPALYNLGNNKIIVLVGTGSDIFTADRTSQAQQIFMGIYDDLSVVAPVATDKTKMLQQTLSTGTTATIRTISDDKFDPTIHGGWYVNLDVGTAITQPNGTTTTSGESVVTQGALVLNTVYFTTRIYQTSESQTKANTNTQTCKVSTQSQKSSGGGWLMGINVLNGGKPNAQSGSSFVDDKGKGTDIAGQYHSNTLSEVVIVSNSSIGKSPDAINDSGEVSSGEISVIDSSKTGNPEAAADCVDNDDYQILVSQANDKNSLINQAITANVCVAGRGLIRMNIREIKENF